MTHRASIVCTRVTSVPMWELILVPAVPRPAVINAVLLVLAGRVWLLIHMTADLFLWPLQTGHPLNQEGIAMFPDHLPPHHSEAQIANCV